MRTLPFILFLALSLAACGGSDSSSETTASESEGETDTEQAASSEEVDQTVTLQPQGNQMKYKQTEFTVAPGETVRLVFENVASSPSMVHNVVIINSTEDDVFERVGEAGSKAGSSNDYIPEDDAVFENTPVAQPGETVEVTFTAPEETGDYGYVCTYPGHWATMQGTMKVRS
ncbi:MAG: plastocyanin/azurin family copper-binding protein [Salinivenus sp.]